MNENHPLVFDLVRGSAVDGPGIRTVVFLKGCPLKCVWCQNPEAWEPDEEIFYDSEKCIACGNCQEGRTCFTKARRVVGQHYSPVRLTDLLLRDCIYYRNSNGGVTFSGGEPMIFGKYLEPVLRELKNAEVHVAIQTSGYFDWSIFRKLVFPYVDLIYYDLKFADPDEHKKYTGKTNELIWSNLVKLARSEKCLKVRVPLVPRITATEHNLRSIATHLTELGIGECEFISYNPSGLQKWIHLGKEPPLELPREPISITEQERWCSLLD